MATAPVSRRLNLTRDQLAAFLTDQQQIRQFELLFSTVDELQVIVGTDFEYQADTAAATANEALAQLSALAQDTAVDDAVLNAKVQQALDAIPGLAQALELLALAPRQELGTIASQNSDNVNITGGLISGLDAPLPVASGGIGVTTAPANQVFSGPTAGAAAAPAFRSLVVADIPALTSGSSILYGNGSGGFSNVTIGTGVSFAAGTLSATGTGGTVTSVTGTSPIVSSGGTTPAISLATGYGDTQNPYAAKTANYVLAAPNGSSGLPTFRALVAADIPALSYVSSIGVTAPITSTGGLTPTIGITQSGAASNGYLSSTDWNTFNNKQPAGTYVTAVSVVSANGLAGTSSGGTTPALTLSTTITGLLKGNGTAISAATSGTDYAPATSGTSILYGNGSGGFSNVTIGSGVSFAAGTLSATGSGGTVTSVATGTGLTGGPITGTGTINFSVAAVGTWAATPSSANLAAAMTDETGSGSLVFANSPTLSQPTIDGVSVAGYEKITGGGSGFVRAYTWYDVGASAGSRGAGAYSVNAANTTNWFWGNPYLTPDKFIIARSASATFSEATAQTSNALLTLENDGRLQMPKTIGVGNASPSTSGAGITFPATVNLSSDPNTLDDYEEGTWTPTLTSVTIGNGVMADATYVKIGQFVYIGFNFYFGSTTTVAAGVVDISGLPFAVAGNGSGAAWLFDATAGGYTLPAVLPTSTSGFFRIGRGTVVGTDQLTNTLPFIWAVNDRINFAGTYRTTA